MYSQALFFFEKERQREGERNGEGGKREETQKTSGGVPKKLRGTIKNWEEVTCKDR